MKKILPLARLLLTVATASAQATLNRGVLQPDAKLGFPGWRVPITVGTDYGIVDDITIGGELSFRSYSTTYFNHSISGIFTNRNCYSNRLFELPFQVGAYAGLSLGYFVASGSSDYVRTSYPQPGCNLQAGARYFFNNKFGVNAEVVFGTIGLTGGEFRVDTTYKL